VAQIKVWDYCGTEGRTCAIFVVFRSSWELTVWGAVLAHMTWDIKARFSCGREGTIFFIYIQLSSFIYLLILWFARVAFAVLWSCVFSLCFPGFYVGFQLAVFPPTLYLLNFKGIIKNYLNFFFNYFHLCFYKNSLF